MTDAEMLGIPIPQIVENSDKTGNYYVYVHIIAQSITGYNNEKYYVGITMREPMARWKDGKGYRHQERFWNAIKKYGWDNIKHFIIGSNLTHEMACFFEKHAIHYLQSNKREFGYNISPGGEGGNVTGKVTAVNQYDIDGHFIKHWKSASEAARGVNVDRTRITHAAKWGGIARGYQWRYSYNNEKTISPYRRKTQKSVYQYSISGKLIKEYNSVLQACKETGLKKDNIGHCLNGKNKTAGGYLWEYKE